MKPFPFLRFCQWSVFGGLQMFAAAVAFAQSPRHAPPVKARTQAPAARPFPVAIDAPAVRYTAASRCLQDACVRDGPAVAGENGRLLPYGALRILPHVLLGFVIFAGLLYLFQRWQERGARRRNNTFRFPKTYVLERPGASHSGGITTGFTPPVWRLAN